MNIFLIGYRGTGKSSVARELAQRLGWHSIDADELLEARAGRTIQQIFAEQGEPAFRDLESTIVQELAAGRRTVVALGGGAVVREMNRRALAGHGIVVWLQADAETIERRLSLDPLTQQRRPNLTAAGGSTEIRQLLAAREPIYREAAQWEIDTRDKSPREIAAEIVNRLQREEPSWISGSN